MDQPKVVEFKMCKTCKAVKAIAKLITYYKECKQYNNTKDATDRMRQNKLYQQKHKDHVINRNLNYYYKMKDVNSSFEWFLGYKHLIKVYTF